MPNLSGDTALRHARHLSVTIGPRPVGSAANTRAAAYLQTNLAELGWEVETQMLEVPAWEPLGTTLTLAGRPWPAEASLFSPECDVTAPAVAVGTLAELRAADLAGRIALLYGDLCAGTGLSARRAVYFPERDGQIMDLLEAKRPAAVLAVHSKAHSLETLFHDWLFPLPSATVPAEAGRELLRAGGAPLALRIASRRGPAASVNVRARLAGVRPERVLLLAHFDSVPGCPGAVDNASGVGCLLALAEALAARRPALSVELLAVNGEEVGGPGDLTYLEHGAATLAEVLAVINLDGVGGWVGCNTVTSLGASAEFQALIAANANRYPGLAPVEPWYASDHTAFVMRGVPAVALSSNGVSDIMHTPADTAEWLSAAKLAEAGGLALDLTRALAERAPGWTRPPQA